MFESITKTDRAITITRQLSPRLLAAVPPNVAQFEVYLKVVVRHQTTGLDVVLDPCKLDWRLGWIVSAIVDPVEQGVTDVSNLEPGWFEVVEKSFLAHLGLIYEVYSGPLMC